MLSFLRLELNLANVAIVVGHQSLGTCAADKSGAVSLLMCCQRLEKKSKPRHKAWVWALFVLTWPCAVTVCEWICAVNHIKAQRRGSVVGTSDPGVLRDTGRLSEGGACDALRHKGWGGPPNLQQLEKQARIKTVICLVNFYGDLWAAAHK